MRLINELLFVALLTFVLVKSQHLLAITHKLPAQCFSFPSSPTGAVTGLEGEEKLVLSSFSEPAVVKVPKENLLFCQNERGEE